MEFINIYDAKTHLSKYLTRLTKTDETFVICRNGKPLAKLIPFTEQRPLKIGVMKGKIKISENFEELPEEWKEYGG